MIYKVLSEYHTRTKIDKHHRFKSWEHCYNYFRNNFRSLNDVKCIDHACLHLAFYLASWGMLRGGSFLLQKDYRIHQYFLNDVVTNKQYHKYYDPEFQHSMTKASVEGINELIQNTNNAYISNISKINGEEKLVNITDTLTSKILLGVYGNVPAYDRYLKAALNLHGIKSQFGEESLLEITEFYNLNRTEFEESQRLFSQEGTHYTPMKLADMYFWQVGFIMEKPNYASEEVQALIKDPTYIKPQMQDNIRTSTRPVVKKGLTESIRKHIIAKLNQAKVEGIPVIELRSGDIHKELKLDNRMPPVCNAMQSLGVYRYEILHDTPSGASSTRLVRYYLE